MQGINLWQIVLENSVALKVVVPLVLVMTVVSALKKKSIFKRKKVTAQELIERGDAYVKKGQLLTEPEKILFKILQHKYGETHHVFCQVRVVDVIQPNTALYKERSREWMALFRQVSQWHFDFVICDKESMEVVRAIELDDKSHKQKDRQRRDMILNKSCVNAKITLERIESNFLLSTME